MKNLFSFIGFSILLLSAAACEKVKNEIRINGNGPVITRTIELSSFNKIDHTGVADYYITIGSPQSVVLKAQQNIIDAMTWGVADHTLKVGLQEHVSIETHDEIRFEITVPSVNNIKLSGVGDVSLSGPDQSILTITLTGVGNINSYALKADTCNIMLSGVGNCYVFARNLLSGALSGVGNIYYKGNPEINLTVTGVGGLVDSNK